MPEDVYAPAPNGGFFSNKRNVLIAAGLLGGGAGLVFLLARQHGSATPSEGETGAADATDLQLSNIANELLQFKGQVGVSNAKNATLLDALGTQLGESTQSIKDAITAGDADVLDKFAQDSISRQAADKQQSSMLNWLNLRQEYEQRQLLISNAINATDDPTTKNYYADQLNSYYTGTWLPAAIAGGYIPDPNAEPEGAGGMSAVSLIWATYDENRDQNYTAYDLMGAGPVRYLQKAK